MPLPVCCACGVPSWVLALLFCWEVPVRLLLLPLLAPDLLDDLPPPALDQILGLLAGMLGLPF